MKGKEGSRGKKSKSGKKSKICAVLVSLLFCTNISFAEFDINVPAIPVEQGGSGNQMFYYQFYEKNERIPGGALELSTDDFPLAMVNTVVAGSLAWNSFVKNDHQINNPVKIMIYRFKEDDAHALSYCVDVYKGNPAESEEKEEYKRTSLNAVINGKYFVLSKEQAEIYDKTGVIYDGFVGIGLPFGSKKGVVFSYDTSTVALHQSDLDNIMNTTRHELGHALGISSYAKTYLENSNDYYFSTPYFDVSGKIDPSKSDRINIWDKYLRVHDALKGQEVSSGKGMIVIFNKSQKAEDYGVNKDYVFDVARNAPYFVGPKTMQIISGVSDEEIAGKTEEDIIKYCQDKIKEQGGLINYSYIYTENAGIKQMKVNGLPIHPYDEETNKPITFDLSHIELKNSMMSHQEFRNWTTFMEAELSSLVDIGYDIDLKQYFGKSFYLDKITADVNTSNFDTTNFTKDYAVGVHVYGTKNNITQVGNIETSGGGSFGVRIDGINDKYMLGKDDSNTAKITVNGSNSIGLGVTYGKGHEIIINKNSSVSAIGENSIAVSFDFGKNVMMGQYIGQKGSFINNESGKDIKLVDNLVSNEINGPLVENFDVYGIIETPGIAKTAIYISENAYVENINIHDGAIITGDIVSRWNSVYGGKYARVQNPNPEEPLITDLNFKGTNQETNQETKFSFSSNIYGETKYIESGKTVEYNTLKMNIENNVNLTLEGKDQTVSVRQIDNNGNINIIGNVKIDTWDEKNSVIGNGAITINNNGPYGTLYLDSSVKVIENKIVFANGTLSVLNDEISNTKIKEVEVKGDSKLSFDLGDTFNISSTTVSNDTAKVSIAQIKANETTVQKLKEGYKYELFEDKELNLDGSSNVYYGGNKYTLARNGKFLEAKIVGKGGLKDAIGDGSTPNYIVAEGETQAIGNLSVDNRNFEISGYELNFNGFKGTGLTIGSNADVIIKTHVYGSDTDLTVKTGGKLTISSLNKGINIGTNDTTAIKVENNASVLLKSENNLINIVGKIEGVDKSAQLVLAGKQIVINKIDPITINNQATDTILNGESKEVTWNLETGNLTVSKNEYLSDKNNEIIFNGGDLNLANGNPSAIKLAKMDVYKVANVAIDVDLKNKKADMFVFASSSSVSFDGGMINIKPNLLNTNAIITEKERVIPFTNEKNNSQDLSGYIDTQRQDLYTPIYKYSFRGNINKEEGYDFVLSRWDTSTYEGYNESIFVAPIATQVGAYLTQLNSYETIFNNANLGKMAEKEKGVWVKPYGTQEDVKLKNGLKVENTQYGTYFGYDSEVSELSNDWNMMYSAYGGYMGGKQKFKGQSVSQNGGQVGLAGFLSKEKFFTGLTVNFGASNSSADTMYGHENFVTLLSGIASKTSYDLNVYGNFIIQPSLLMSYSYIKTLDYKTAAHVDMESDPLNVFQITPGAKLIAQLPYNWQPYIGVQMVWNKFDETRFKAQKEKLPNFELDSYVSYGVGVQKSFGENLSGYAQVDFRNSGRKGINGNLGIKYRI